MTRPSALNLVRVGGATAVPDILRNLGADADRVIGAAGVSPSILADPENVIPFSMLAKLIQQCVDATRSPAVDAYGSNPPCLRPFYGQPQQAPMKAQFAWALRGSG